MVPEKISKVRRLLYVAPAKVTSEIDVFCVPKGLDDIRLVYNGTSCGLNKILWAPWFSLPTITSHLRSIEAGSFMGDMDIGDCWHNFVLNESIQGLVGLNWSHHKFNTQDLGPLGVLLPNYDTATWKDNVHLLGGECFKRQCMGLRPSPYTCICDMRRAEEFVGGNRYDDINPFHWCEVQFNLPGMEDYTPARSRVYIIRRDRKLAVAII